MASVLKIVAEEVINKHFSTPFKVETMSSFIPFAISIKFHNYLPQHNTILKLVKGLERESPRGMIYGVQIICGHFWDTIELINTTLSLSSTIWKEEGKCPKCGFLAPFTLMGLICPTHGFYGGI